MPSRRKDRKPCSFPATSPNEPFVDPQWNSTVAELGRLDILVNNAAYQQTTEDFGDITDAQWEQTFRTNISGYFYMAQAALPHLGPGSAIINCGSITGFEGSKTLD